MNIEKLTREPRQERSRATLERLLNATIGILDQSGLEGAIIPRIAQEAGMAPANVYRRFNNKNALLQAAFLHALTQSESSNSQLLEMQLHGGSLAESGGKLMRLLFDQYQRHPRFRRALSHFIDTDADPEFVQVARKMISANVDLVVRSVLVHRQEIRHVPPEPALRFAVLNATCAIEAYALDPQSIWHVEPAVSPDALLENLVRCFVAYLTSGPAANPE